jgi:hypothetical protein
VAALALSSLFCGTFIVSGDRLSSRRTMVNCVKIHGIANAGFHIIGSRIGISTSTRILIELSYRDGTGHRESTLTMKKNQNVTKKSS